MILYFVLILLILAIATCRIVANRRIDKRMYVLYTYVL